jgi:voltage-gated potassium channel
MSKLKLLYYILKTSGMTKVLFSFLIFFFISAIIIWLVDSNVESFFDAIWFCVAVVTTIGFGDIVVTNIVARIVTIILALYGILVVAVITGVIVYYISKILDLNEHSQEELQKISAQVKKAYNDQ